MHEEPSYHQTVHVQEVNGLINEINHEEELRTLIRVEVEELENIFN